MAYGGAMARHPLAPYPLALLMAWLAACSGPPPAAPDAESAADTAETADSPGARCVAEASAALEPIADEPRKIEVAHVLVKWAGADRADDTITRGREEACLRAAEALGALKEGSAFDEVAGSYSDEAGAATRGGVIGEVSREDVAAAFADAAFRLDVGQVSHVVESPFGFHIILRSR